MRPRCRALTLTELLTVVSVISILASMISPVLIRGRQEALRHACIGNLSQMYRALGLYANGNFGKFPNCFDLPPLAPNTNGSPIESPISSWWYNKIWRIANPTLGELGSAAITANQCFLRCPATRDPFDQSHAPSYYAQVDGPDKDRVFDDCYGYNNAGMWKTPNVGYGFGYDTTGLVTPAVEPGTFRPPTYMAVSKYYRTSWPREVVNVYSGSMGYNPTVAPLGQFRMGYGMQCVSGRHYAFAPTADPATWTCTSCGSNGIRVQFGPIGAWSDIREAASTILMMDYAKADANPSVVTETFGVYGGVDEGTVEEYYRTDGRNKNTGTNGYGFRHAGKANVVFAAGNIQGFTRSSFFSIVQTPKAHWEVFR